ncbi:5-oxoprolinase subunit B family protein [Alteromonas facilis]|uniref:5-oxoprolinase subunit B family protein n=1 Tax=Alteromonas facilis TaxID=2048004 RepID=UPI000C28E755|nr:carboxyltransferase domain-containing protein [Alteromonas facilis]
MNVPKFKQTWFISEYAHCGEQSIIFNFDGDSLLLRNQRVISFYHAIRDNAPVWVTDIVPSFDTLMIAYDVTQKGYFDVLSWVTSIEASHSTSQRASHHTIAVNYSMSERFDLAELSTTLRLSAREIVELHTSVSLKVFAIGFTPGFAYLGELPEALTIARKATPRTAVPEGSVAIADQYSAVYPMVSPGGWNLLGSVVDLAAYRSLSLRVGDTVQYTCNSLIDD